MKKRLGQLLVNDGVITVDQLNNALAEQREHKGLLGNILLEMDLISDEILSKYLQTQKKLRDSDKIN